LASTYVGPEMGAIGNEGQGWLFWNLNGREIKIGQRVLHQRFETCPIVHGDTIACYPFSLRVFLDAEELRTDEDNNHRLDQRCAELVRELHKELTELLVGALSDRTEQLTDRYIQALEQHLED